jgi:hypothetical protein
MAGVSLVSGDEETLTPRSSSPASVGRKTRVTPARYRNRGRTPGLEVRISVPERQESAAVSP